MDLLRISARVAQEASKMIGVLTNPNDLSQSRITASGLATEDFVRELHALVSAGEYGFSDQAEMPHMDTASAAMSIDGDSLHVIIKDDLEYMEGVFSIPDLEKNFQSARQDSGEFVLNVPMTVICDSYDSQD